MNLTTLWRDDQSQCFMTIFRNFKSQSKHLATEMDKGTVIIATKILDKVKDQFPETTVFISERLEQVCLKEDISVEKVIFLLTCLEAKR